MKKDKALEARIRLEEFMKLEAIYRIESEARDHPVGNSTLAETKARDLNVLAAMAASREQMFDKWRHEIYLRMKGVPDEQAETSTGD